MASLTCAKTDRMTVCIHGCTGADLLKWAKAFNVEVEEHVRTSGKTFKTVDVEIGEAKISLFS